MLPVTFSHDGYRYFLTRFMRAGYESHFFSDPIPEKQGLFIRHDIDFDATSAAQMAVIERNLGIKSTYFFQVTGNIYNPASKSFQQSLEVIVQSGHEIGLYFDPTAYPDVEKGVKDEMKIFEFLLKRTAKIASIVKPAKHFKEGNGHLYHIPHCYESQFSSRMTLFTDDLCQFREEMPLESEDFIQKKNIHLQIQPIWWIMPAKDASGKMQMLLERQLSRYTSYHLQRHPGFRTD
jgi:hypothetical protein